MSEGVNPVERIGAIDIGLQRRELGRTVHDEDTATLAPMRGMKVAFDRPERAPEMGEQVPPGWHHVYFVPTAPLAGLGADGLPLDNGVLPEMPLPRRMHAGNRLTFHSPILVGEQLRRECEFSGIQLRQGRTGPLIFTVQTRRIYTGRGLAITEENTSVFRAQEEPGTKKDPPPGERPPSDAPWQRSVKPDPVSLFRYSALTFNPHRIHFDRIYARETEGYPGLVVHGMFTGQCLLDLARDQMPDVRIARFNFRAIAPLFDTSPYQLLGRPAPDTKHIDLWAVNPQGTVAMKVDIDYE